MPTPRFRHVQLLLLLLIPGAWGIHDGSPLARAEGIRLVSAADPALRALPASTGNGASEGPRLSCDGRFLIFTSEASNLVTNDSNGGRLDVFVRGLAAGRTTLVSVNPLGFSGNGDSWGPDISADGRYVAFVSRASDLVPGDTNRVADVFLRDLVEGVTRRVSVATDGTPADGDCFSPQLSADGRQVCFGSRATRLEKRDDSSTRARGRVPVRVPGGSDRPGHGLRPGALPARSLRLGRRRAVR